MLIAYLLQTTRVPPQDDSVIIVGQVCSHCYTLLLKVDCANAPADGCAWRFALHSSRTLSPSAPRPSQSTHRAHHTRPPTSRACPPTVHGLKIAYARLQAKKKVPRVVLSGHVGEGDTLTTTSAVLRAFQRRRHRSRITKRTLHHHHGRQRYSDPAIASTRAYLAVLCEAKTCCGQLDCLQRRVTVRARAGIWQHLHIAVGA
jgi:hypothetical protein